MTASKLGSDSAMSAADTLVAALVVILVVIVFVFICSLRVVARPATGNKGGAAQ